MAQKFYIGKSSIEDSNGLKLSQSLTVNNDLNIVGGCNLVFKDGIVGGSITTGFNGEVPVIQIDANGSIYIANTSTFLDTASFQKRILGRQGSNTASASLVTLGDGNTFTITGTTAISRIDTTNWTTGSVIYLRFGGNLALTHGAGGGAGQLYLNNGVNRSISAGNQMSFVLIDVSGTLYWRELSYTAG